MGESPAATAARMLARGRRAWADLDAGHRHLEAARYATLEVAGWRVRVQCNPGRRRSNRARVDRRSIAARPCFLCPANRPPEQEELVWGEGWLILANPAPIFPAHYTLVHRPHGTGRVVDRLGDLLDLARDLGPELSLFYNGPRAGASAPDHFHFQAYTRGWLPTEEELLGGAPRADSLCTVNLAGVKARVHDAAGRGVVEVRAPEREGAIAAVRAVVEALPPAETEPDLNLVCRHEADGWRLALFPRRAHRPACYFATGAEQLLVSPGAADMAGLMVVTREADLARLDARRVAAIYAEVALDGVGLAARLEGVGP